ncbi:GC-rich sequence DNA-binding factor-like protein-domain-containing protein [Armillaria luteobubalina]|uniref:GC-rich sequence DNA-binding factor-like protein-domain-containing protein n=1 Tax=Armillaria luteobubalina TaxID=153913 RepID=A0AA39QGD1_9AGAR|nr:GC-rich sequence DNA-binding factor-like protein-domain-containing protein [Armillaria luteobubalina]
MARRKRVLEDDDDSDSSVGSESGGEGTEDDPHHRKRRRKDGKEDAIYGVFGDDSDEEVYQRRPTKKKKQPTFVSQKEPEILSMDVDAGDELEEDDTDAADSEGEEGEDTRDVSDESEPSRLPSHRVRDEDEDEDSPFMPVGGLGSKRSVAGIGSTSSPLSKGGIGAGKSTTIQSAFSKGGIGATSSLFAKSTSAETSEASASTSTYTPPSKDLPSAFGGNRSTSFLRNSGLTPEPPVLSHAEQAHFQNISGSFGARMLAKMGWQAGTGLGTTGEGIVTPVETKMRPGRVGIAFRGFKERTEQSKMEARRRGEVVSDDEEDSKVKKAKKREKAAKEKRSAVWKNPKKIKTKIEHKTYEEILADAGENVSSASGVGQIIDATGAVPREVNSLADISLNTWSPSNDPTRIPEVRHNIRLITDACKTDLDGLAREAKSLDDKKKWVVKEDARLRKRVEEEAELIARLQQVQLVANEFDAKSRELAAAYEVSLDPFSPLVYRLLSEYSNEYDKYRLDEIVVAAIAPSVRRMVSQWDPLQDPTFLISTFRSWRLALRVSSPPEKPQTQVDVYGTQVTRAPVIEAEKPMTPFESLLWSVWLPRVRAFINNEWSAQSPTSAVKLYEAWSSFLPTFISDNFLDQLILPKVQKAVAAWSPKHDTVTLQEIVFPWLPYVGLRLEEVIGDARRKVKSLLRSWTAGDDIPKDLIAWKDVFDSSVWDSILLKYVVPKLGSTLRNDLRINPRNQRMEPLQHVLQWAEFIRPNVFSRLLETEFFPKWLDVLHIWLIQPNVNFEEVARWYSEVWKAAFPEDVQSMPGVSRGFTCGLQLMNKALELGPDAPTRLPKPDFLAAAASHTPSRNGTSKTQPRSSARTQEITFRSIVEEFAASHNLLFLPTGRAHEKSRMPLFRVSPSADGKGGLLVYILDDAVWAATEGVGSTTEDYVAISLDAMVLRASN